MKELKDLKVGDLVILKYDGYYFNDEDVAKIDKITSKGFIKVRGMLFYPDGRSRSDLDYSIEVATDGK